jgi:hypothetical protein
MDGSKGNHLIDCVRGVDRFNIALLLGITNVEHEVVTEYVGEEHEHHNRQQNIIPNTRVQHQLHHSLLQIVHVHRVLYMMRT